VHIGGFSTVAEGLDQTRTDCSGQQLKVAIKKISDPWKDEPMARRCYRELRLLRWFQQSW
jgi:hypothetical protein